MDLIEDRAAIGDGQSIALVRRDGAIDWLCLPRFDSPPCFAALLGGPENGVWWLGPADAGTCAHRAYRDGTLVLETVFDRPDGTVAIVDFMGPGPGTVARIVEARRGAVRCASDFAPRRDFGRRAPVFSPMADGTGFFAGTGDERLAIRADVPMRVENGAVAARFALAAGERAWFSLAYAPEGAPFPNGPDMDRAQAEVEAAWRGWIARSTYRGRWRGAVERALLTLKALTFAPTGAMAAAPTTSLPEWIGGSRNWDYRFCWPRDSSLAALALMGAGVGAEALALADFLARSVPAGEAALPPLLGVTGAPPPPEREIPWLAGFAASRPVRAGNAAVAQTQLDVFGEVELALFELVARGLAPAGRHWPFRRAAIEHLETVWRGPDEGIWEVRGGPRQFTLSKVMVWVAFDRAIRTAETHGLPAPLARWRAARAACREMVLTRGFNRDRGAFTQTLDGIVLDASLLLLPLVGFLPPDDPRIAGTVAAIGRELSANGLIRRYATETGADGLPPGEGVFLACGFWYVSALALGGQRTEAAALFEHMLGLANDVGLLAEEYDPVARRQLGNFPQGFSHLALIGAALALDGGTAMPPG